MTTFEHFCGGCEARWHDHEFHPTCPQCGSQLVENWPKDNDASDDAMDLARVWRGVALDE